MRTIPLFIFSTERFLHVLFLIVFCAISTFYSYAQASIDEAIMKFENISRTSAREKIYIHFDRSNYLAGEDIWYQIYLVDAKTNKQEALSKVVYVDLIGPANKILISKTFKISDGCVEGDFELDENLIQGQYTVRAYTSYMRNFDASHFFRKKIQINSNRFHNTSVGVSSPIGSMEHETRLITSAVNPNVQFFPEGGNLVDNFINRVGFRVVGINGKGIDIKGRIVDEAGKKVTSIRTSKFGMGDFSFIPILGKSYKAELIYNNLAFFHELPSSQSEGVLMHVMEYQDNYRISLESSLPKGTKDLQVIGSKNGEVICNATLVEDKTKTMVNISKDILEPGIVQFTVLDDRGIPLCERLVFVENEALERTVNITSSKKEYGKRDFVELEISMNKLKKKDSKANVSISITDVTFEHGDSLEMDIKSHLFLNSELKGEVEHPGYYLYSKDPRRKGNLDLLMMCQGRQFIWNEAIYESEQRIKYPMEQGFSFKGNVRKYSNHTKAEPVTVSIMIRNKDKLWVGEVLTNAEGYFEFGDYEIHDNTSIVIQAKKPIPKKAISKRSLEYPKTNYFIELDTFERPEIIIKPIVSNEYHSNQVMEGSQPLDDRDSVFELTEDRVELEEVELASHISAEKYDEYVKNKQLYRNPTHRVDFNEFGKYVTGNVLQNLSGRIPGFTTMYIGGELIGYFTRYGMNGRPPLYLLDGMPVQLETIKIIPMVEVLFVDVLMGTKAVVYGSEGSNGVIAVYTRDRLDIPEANSKRRGIIYFVHPGYSQVRKFYEPVYKTKELNQEKQDNRATIYWKPMVKLDEGGKAKISFYSADIATTYRVLLEGVTDDGEPIMEVSFISIE